MLSAAEEFVQLRDTGSNPTDYLRAAKNLGT
jgi:hypothetical protein